MTIAGLLIVFKNDKGASVVLHPNVLLELWEISQNCVEVSGWLFLVALKLKLKIRHYSCFREIGYKQKMHAVDEGNLFNIICFDWKSGEAGLQLPVFLYIVFCWSQINPALVIMWYFWFILEYNSFSMVLVRLEEHITRNVLLFKVIVSIIICTYRILYSTVSGLKTAKSVKLVTWFFSHVESSSCVIGSSRYSLVWGSLSSICITFWRTKQ